MTESQNNFCDLLHNFESYLLPSFSSLCGNFSRLANCKMCFKSLSALTFTLEIWAQAWTAYIADERLLRMCFRAYLCERMWQTHTHTAKSHSVIRMSQSLPFYFSKRKGLSLQKSICKRSPQTAKHFAISFFVPHRPLPSLPSLRPSSSESFPSHKQRPPRFSEAAAASSYQPVTSYPRSRLLFRERRKSSAKIKKVVPAKPVSTTSQIYLYLTCPVCLRVASLSGSRNVKKKKRKKKVQTSSRWPFTARPKNPLGSVFWCCTFSLRLLFAGCCSTLNILSLTYIIYTTLNAYLKSQILACRYSSVTLTYDFNCTSIQLSHILVINQYKITLKSIGASKLF